MDSPIRMIVMDMDGTLLTHRPGMPASISEGNLMALRAAHDAGIRLVIASGRMPDDAGAFAVDAGLPMAILSLNGAVCQHQPLGQILDSQTMPDASARRLWDRVNELKLEAGLFGGHSLVTTWPLKDEMAYHRWGTWLTKPGTRCRVRDLGQGAEEILASGAHKMVILSQEQPQVLAQLRRELQENEPGLEVCSSWIANIEVNAGGVNKGTALARLAQRFGIPMEQVMAIGDNGNDISMIRAAGIGVAMGNATAETKEAANRITRSVHEDGVAAAIRAIALGEAMEGVYAL